MKTRIPAGLSAVLHGRLAPAKLALLGWRAARHVRGVVPRPWLRITARPAGCPCAESVVLMHKRRGLLTAIEADVPWLRGRSGFTTAWRRLGVFVDLLSDPRVPDGEWRADLSDHVRDAGPVLGFCSNLPGTILVPDRGFHASGGYARRRAATARAAGFDDRDGTIVWRGSPTGFGAVANGSMRVDDADLRQRVRMCLLLRDAVAAEPGLGVDARIVAGRGVPPEAADSLRRAGIAGPPVPEDSWLRRRFAIDVDGNANAFSNLFLRLLFGCCVIKIDSPLRYRQWYYDRLVPGTHYVRVRADLSDLVDRIAWCRGHEAECRRIAAAGRDLAAGMTLAAERRSTIDAIVASTRARPGAAAVP